MLLSTIIMGWLGVLIFLFIFISFKNMMKNNEFAFIHILMVLMYAMWLPLPIVLSRLLNSEILQTGTIFGLVYLIMLVITMAFQTGHISYLTKNNHDKTINDETGNYMMITLSSPFESLANVFRCIWAIFLGFAFWNNNEILMASLMFLFSLLIFYYLFIALNQSLVRQVKLFTKVKPNPYLINLETLLFFIVLIVHITYKY